MMTNINLSEAGKADENLQQSLPDIKLVRESKGLTLRDICEVTKVSIIHLQAIENEDFHLLPPPVYSKSFIKKYAETVGIESGLMLSRYEKYLNANRKPAEQDKLERKSLIGKSIYKLIGAFLILIIGAALAIFPLASNRKTDKSEDIKNTIMESTPPAAQMINPDVTDPKLQNKEGTTDNVASPIVVRKDNIKAEEDKIIPQTKDENIDKLKLERDKPNSKAGMHNVETAQQLYALTIEARELTWIRITGDNNAKPYEALLKPGDKVERTASKSFLIDIGNAGGVDIFFQGKSLGSLGKEGEVVHLSLP